ncbi:GLIPR2 [Bugula neritina]|uniref:GLIPR2 n=1 Tax=Bugula neritina TaxID=10212 RepID=A0A7J7ITF4_BUGNE|nr:GLIPR2 [Bugula neritina]
MFPLAALAIICVSFLQSGTFPEIDNQTLLLINNGGIIGGKHESYCDRESCDDFIDEAEIKRVAEEKAALERALKEKAEQERIERERRKSRTRKNREERAEQERIERERVEQERIERERAEQERIERERAEQERIERERAEQERIERERAEQEKKAEVAQDSGESKETEQDADDKHIPDVPEQKPSSEPEPYEGGTKWTKQQLQSLEKHNELRTLHGSPPLSLSPKLCNMATKYAQHLASIDQMKHTTLEERENAGENLYSEHGMGVNNGEGERGVEWWYNEIQDYSFDQPGFGMSTGHFTQVLWKETEEVGVGVAVSSSGKTYVVANYWPAGNVEKQFETNVLKKK